MYKFFAFGDSNLSDLSIAIIKRSILSYRNSIFSTFLSSSIFRNPFPKQSS